MSVKILKETELAKKLIDSFDGFDYEIFQEVKLCYGSIVDIVLKHGNIIWAIEVKTQLSMDVLYQAYENRKYFHFSSIAVPYTKSKHKGRNFARQVAQDYGIGIFLIGWMDSVSEDVKAKLNRKAYTKRIELVPEQKTYAKAGNNESKYWTPFQGTKREVINYVKKNNGDCSIREVMNHVKHHYSTISSAANSMREWINRGIIPELVIEDGKVYFVKN